VDEGLPIAYQVLDAGVPVYAVDGAEVGIVDHVVAAPNQDIFHGIVLRIGDAQRFLAADDVASLHERGVDLRISAAAIAELPEPHGAGLAWRPSGAGVKPTPWSHLVGLMGGESAHRREWTRDE
jgi:hypothetical protein